jgi:hypothetical protein
MFHYCGDGMTDVVQQPRARIPLLWSEVKERCNALSIPEILALGSESKIAEVIHLQVSDYTYTYPTVTRVSGEHPYLCELIPVLCQNGSLSGLVQRTRPYRNARIILAIQELFFTGGDASFVSRFNHLFPVHQDSYCVLTHEVPVPMVALVVTAVS